MSNAEILRRRLAGGSVLLAVLLATGCSLPGRTTPPAARVYVLQDAPRGPADGGGDARACLTLRIATPRSAPGFDTARMAYAEESAELRYFAWHAWADTPARMLGLLAEQRFDAQERYAGVLSGAADLATDLRLELEQVRLLQSIRNDSAEVLLSAKMRLVDPQERRLLGERTVQVAVPAAAAGPVTGVRAAQHATGQFLDTLEQFVAAAATAECPR